jgi:hypothetical protein
METKARLKKLEDLTGKKFNRLTVLRLDKERTRNDKYWRVFWICECECGKIKSVVAGGLRSGSTKSCGCWKLENSREVCRKNFTKETTILPRRDIFTQYAAKCKTKKIEFLIGECDFYELIEKPCYYCGDGLNNVKTVRTSSTKIKTYHYNGIDRIDNSKGYIKDNVVPCCNICNKAKRDLPLTNFYKWVIMIHDNLIKTKQI